MPSAGVIDTQMAESFLIRKEAVKEFCFLSISALAAILAENHSNRVSVAVRFFSRLSGRGQFRPVAGRVSFAGGGKSFLVRHAIEAKINHSAKKRSMVTCRFIRLP